jgi:hypothetical protein
MKLKVSFQPGAYSSNKDTIKKVFNILDYKYKGAQKANDERMICFWQRSPEKQMIKGIFNGSGKECDFIVECNDDEVQVFQSFEKSFNARISVYSENTEIASNLMEKAKQLVDQWFTWQKPYKDEPPLFYEKRIESNKKSYEWFIQRQYDKLKAGSVI